MKGLRQMTRAQLIAGIIISVLYGGAQAAQVTLAWDANSPAPDGYHLFQRTEGGTYNYDSPVWSGTATTCTIDGLADGSTYYFVARAFKDGDQSGDSNQVTYFVVTPAPVPTATPGPTPSPSPTPEQMVQIPVSEFKRHISNLKSAGSRITNESARMEEILSQQEPAVGSK